MESPIFKSNNDGLNLDGPGIRYYIRILVPNGNSELVFKYQIFQLEPKIRLKVKQPKHQLTV